MKKPTVAVVFGSRSTEHDISILTALAAIIKPLLLSHKYNVLPVYIAKDGRWFAGARYQDIQLYQSGKIDEVMASDTPVSLLFGKDGGLSLVRAKRLGTAVQSIDVVFPATHGTHGEDGELMAVCEMANVPYVGCNAESSVIAMDKVLAKQVALANGIATSAFVPFTKRAFEADSDSWVARINKELRYPLFIKPAHLGSSIGISRITDKKDLANAIEVALQYDNKALAEEGVNNLIEVTLPIMGNDAPEPAYLEEPLLKSEDFFDFETKYMQGGKGKGKSGGKGGKQGAQGYSRIPAELPEALYAKAEMTGLAVYRALGCTGTARVDMLIDSKSDTVYFNEVNPLPGSLYAHNWRQKGVSNVELVVRLVELATSLHAERQSLSTVFATSFLKQF
jgi:D-alanine-D-alanine ligase